MAKQKTNQALDVDTDGDTELKMTHKEALDTLLAICAKSKQEIRRGDYYTQEEVRVMMAAKSLARHGKK